jgi:hypothetical protein
MRELLCFQQCPQSIACFPFSHNFSTKGLKKQWGKKKSKKQQNEQPWTLAYILVLQTMSSPLNSFFLGPNNWAFPPK